MKDKDFVKKFNSEILRISNNGKFISNISFALKSHMSDNKSPFVLDEDKLSLKPDDLVHPFKIWTFPTEIGEFSDDLIVLIEDNPLPTVFRFNCTGVKPIIEVSETDITFERILLNQSKNKSFIITNTSTIPVNWSLS